jgi:uncharacterized protein YjbI with pentapeptide repeats
MKNMQFDPANWTEELYALNSWARGDGEFDEKKRLSEALARYDGGVETWNAWARSMLNSRKLLEEAGLWNATRSWDQELLSQKETPQGAQTRLWINLATVDFANRTFSGPSNFGGFQFPSEANFSGSIFEGKADFEGALFQGAARFSGAEFGQEAWFRKLHCLDDAVFHGTKFLGGHSTFSRAQFELDARFDEAVFESTASFRAARFGEFASFEKVKFMKYAGFSDGADFNRVKFVDTEFHGKAWFGQATFRGNAWFSRTHFYRGEPPLGPTGTELTRDLSPDFAGVAAERAFLLDDVVFEVVPDFTQSTFAEAPRLDNVRTPRHSFLGWTGARDSSVRFRELKRLAAAANNRERELEFFAQEFRTARFGGEGLRVFVPRIWRWRFWFGLFYETLSNFGRSFVLPITFWLVLFAASATFYFAQSHPQEFSWIENTMLLWGSSIDPGSRACALTGTDRIAVTGTDRAKEAFFLSLKNGVVGLDGNRGDSARRTYACLYGMDRSDDRQPVVPYAVSLVSIGQTIMSAVLIFLFLLAVRNLLRLN